MYNYNCEIPNVVVAAVKSQGAIVKGELGGLCVEVMMDSGSSISLMMESFAKNYENRSTIKGLKLVSAAGEPIPVIGKVIAPITVGALCVDHNFVVVHSLITPVILGIDFLQKHGIVLDFTTMPVTIHNINPLIDHDIPPEAQPILDTARNTTRKVCAVASVTESNEDIIDNCAVPLFSTETTYDMPRSQDSDFTALLETHRKLFCDTPGKTNLTEHFIPTVGNPVKVPPRRIPANYRAEIEQQISSMLQQGIIEVSSSPWMAPAVFVRKKSGEIRLCVDYRELNKKTVKDAYPLPRPDEVQDRLRGSTIFSTFDLKSGYWQLPVHQDDQPKTAFCPGSGFGLFQFCRMPFGLSGAPGSFQRLMNNVCGDLPFVTTYLDDLLVHSMSKEEHLQHLHVMFQKMSAAGLTFRGSKCHIGLSQVTYLGHVFSAAGMGPDPHKVSAVRDWMTPTDQASLRSFLGLASYYRRYIPCFANLAAPLYHLTNKGVTFDWNSTCQSAFNNLKDALIQAPILKYPDFTPLAKPFHLYTDASATGIGAVLEQSSHVVAYVSRALSKAEQNYSVIQKECLALVYALKQFRHYLLGRPFKILTDHAPLQWLSAQKMEGLLARWALAIQEYEFTITYRRGHENGNADALSRRTYPDVQLIAATSQTPSLTETLHQQQLSDPTIQHLHTALSHASPTHAPPQSSEWRRSPLSRYKQLWPQLFLHDGIVCRQYAPNPNLPPVTVPIIPASQRSSLFKQYHDIPSAGHLGFEKTAAKLRQVGYWVGMLQDIAKYCRDCIVCQRTKPPIPMKAPLTSVPIGRPWEMVAVDILEVPLSLHNNRYLLVIQDYMTKWAEAIPLPNQTAACITNELVKVFSRYGIPDILHSDQGRNFESTILCQTLEAFGVTKSHTTAYHPAGDGLVERFNRSLLQMLRAYTQQHSDWEKYLHFVLYAYRTATHSSTGVSPFELMFGRCAHKPPLSNKMAHDVISYQDQLRAKLAHLYDFVELNNVEASHHQKRNFDQHAQSRTFSVGDTVWLSIPTAGKLDPKWEGEWVIQSVQSPVTYTIHDGRRTRTVHINRLRPRLQPVANTTITPTHLPQQTWQPPSVDHIVYSENICQPRYPTRVRRPPERYQP